MSMMKTRWLSSAEMASVAAVGRHRELHERVRVAGDVGQLDMLLLDVHGGHLVHAEAGRVDGVAARLERERVRSREEHGQLVDRHVGAADDPDPLRRVDGRHRACDEEQVLRRVEREHAGRLERHLRDQPVRAVELQDPVLADQRDVPVRAVRLDRDMVRPRVGGEPEPAASPRCGRSRFVAMSMTETDASFWLQT
jgi:hypothetical protein